MRRRQHRGLALRAAMAGTGQWWIQRSSNDYKLIRSLGGGEFLSYDWRVITSGIPGPYLNLHQLGFARVGVPMLSVDDRDGTYDATGWTVMMGTTATQGYKAITVAGSIASGTLTRFTADAGAGTFKANDKGRRIQIPGANAGTDLTVLISTVAADGSYVTWTSPSGTVGSYTATLHASYRYTVTVGNSATWTSPAGATALGVRRLGNTSGGLFKVAVDGSTTAANWLPTAQSKVDGGEYPSTILVANGGTLNPTDRVLDCYSSSTLWDDPLVIADGLTPGAHTIVLTNTGYTHTGGIAARAQLTGFSYSTGSETPSTSGADILGTFQWQTGASAHEYAYRWLPDFGADGTTPNPNAGTAPINYFSRVHGYEEEVGFTITVDGVTTTVADGTTVAVTDKATIVQTSKLHHPDNDPVNAADVTTVYTLDADGLTVEHTDTWHVAGVMNGGYPSMLPTAGAFDRFTSSGLFQRLTVNSGAGGGVGYANAYISAAWTAGGKYATSTEMVAPASVLTAGTQSPALDQWWYEDRAPSSGVKINKMYHPWKATPGSPVVIHPGDVWHFKTRYRYKRFPGGAESTLARV